MNAAVIVAGGTGERFGTPRGKQLALVGGLPVVSHALRAFEETEMVDAVVLVTHPDRVAEYREAAVEPLRLRKVRAVVPGGATRRDSVACGVAALEMDVEAIAVHDGARPLIMPSTIEAAFSLLFSDPKLDGVAVGHAAIDTVHTLGRDGVIAGTLDRAAIWQAQTPQVFRAACLRRALDATQGADSTDDAGMVVRAAGRVATLEGPRENIKVTVADDLAFVDHVLAMRSEGEA